MPEKYPLREFCKERFNIDSSSNDLFSKIKHYFVVGESYKDEI